MLTIGFKNVIIRVTPIGKEVKIMKLFKVSKKALEQYRTTVKGNENTPDDQVVKKLSRNIQLVIETAPERITKGFFRTTFKYGNLYILTRGDTVVKILNHKGSPAKWKFPRQRYIEINEQLGITDCKYNSKKSS